MITRAQVQEICDRYGIELKSAPYLADEENLTGCSIILEEIRDRDGFSEAINELEALGLLVFRSRREMAQTLAPSLYGRYEEE